MKSNTDKLKLIVVGNGMAGVACIEEVLKIDPDKYEITVFGSEKHLNYNRVLLSQVLTGEKTVEEISTHPRAWYDERGIKLHLGSRISEIRRRSRTVVSDDGVEAHYDKLILATGSRPFIPPIPGTDKEGVLSFRDIDDCERIQALTDKGARAIVIGGGLLGLEAAFGLTSLGSDVTVVHLMDRLMERQLDSIAAGFLKKDIEDLGITVMLNKETAEITGNGRVEGVRFADGGLIEAELVVMSVGIRPNSELAASNGIYCERGIVVSDTMQTFDPAVYAVGECVQHRGVTFGLVAPLFEQARVLADHLAGTSRLVFKSRATSTRLKIPGIELYSAGTVDTGPGTEGIEYLDKSMGIYKKLTIEDNRITGIVMYGDIVDGPRLFASLMDEVDIAPKRGSILFGEGVGAAESPVDEMPDDAIVCGCNGITKGMIVEAIEQKGLFTREDVARETRASSSCGGCASIVDRILEATLGASFEGAPTESNICPCTKYSREDVIKNIREQHLTSVGAVMGTLGWETVGCELCRPALNYYVSMVWPAESEDDTTSRLVNEREHANIQDDGTFSVVPRMYGGATSPEELKRVAEAALKFKVPLVKLTGGQRIDLLGVKREDLAPIWKELDMDSGYAYGKALRTVKTCVGSPWCRYGTQDSLSLGILIEKHLAGLWMPAKLKMGVTGCPRNCAESGIKDIGIVGVSGAWEIYAGGCGGIELKRAERLATVKTSEEAHKIVSAFIQYYREDAHYGERTFKWLRRVGVETIKNAVVEDTANRNHLCERLEEALGATKDPWKEKTRDHSQNALGGTPG